MYPAGLLQALSRPGPTIWIRAALSMLRAAPDGRGSQAASMIPAPEIAPYGAVRQQHRPPISTLTNNGKGKAAATAVKASADAFTPAWRGRQIGPDADEAGGIGNSRVSRRSPSPLRAEHQVHVAVSFESGRGSTKRQAGLLKLMVVCVTPAGGDDVGPGC